MSHRSFRLPIHHDDGRFRDQTERMFRDMQFRMNQDFPGRDPRDFAGGREWSGWPDESSAFFHLNPRQIPMQQVGASERGSREALDDDTSDSLFVEDPQTKSRMFNMSFDVKKYDPSEVRVRVEDRDLIVEAKQTKQGITNEFSRKIVLPQEVDADKLTSVLSSDGILTLQAPCPPSYRDLTSSQPFIRPPQSQPEPSRAPPMPLHYPPPQQQQQLPPQQQQLSQQQQQQQQLPSRSLPVVINVMPSVPANIPSDTPIFTTVEGGRRRLDLVIDFGRQYEAKDVVVKLDGRKMIVEATREEKHQGRVCKSSVQREFDLSEDIDPTTVQALMRADGQLAIVATSLVRK